MSRPTITRPTIRLYNHFVLLIMIEPYFFHALIVYSEINVFLFYLFIFKLYLSSLQILGVGRLFERIHGGGAAIEDDLFEHVAQAVLMREEYADCAQYGQPLLLLPQQRGIDTLSCLVEQLPFVPLDAEVLCGQK
jgi:hypothetical protein